MHSTIGTRRSTHFRPNVAATERRRGRLPRLIGVLLLLYIVFQIAVAAVLLLQGMPLVAGAVLLLGPLIGVLLTDALLLYMKITRSLRSVRDDICRHRSFV